MRHMVLFFTLAATIALRASPAPDSWPQFRGPGARGISDNARLPLTWSDIENVAWKRPVRGSGWSSPVVWGNKIFLTSVESEGEEERIKGGLYFGGERPVPKDVHHWWVNCIDLESGEILWQKEILKEAPRFSRHLKNTFASETAAVDAERVYFYFAQKGVFVFTHGGKEVWRREQGPFKTLNGWGTASSPVVH